MSEEKYSVLLVTLEIENKLEYHALLKTGGNSVVGSATLVKTYTSLTMDQFHEMLDLTRQQRRGEINTSDLENMLPSNQKV